MQLPRLVKVPPHPVERPLADVVLERDARNAPLRGHHGKQSALMLASALAAKAFDLVPRPLARRGVVQAGIADQPLLFLRQTDAALLLIFGCPREFWWFVS